MQKVEDNLEKRLFFSPRKVVVLPLNSPKSDNRSKPSPHPLRLIVLAHIHYPSLYCSIREIIVGIRCWVFNFGFWVFDFPIGFWFSSCLTPTLLSCVIDLRIEFGF
ncbi:hypothetical protein Droror1_Dr00008107 [Drosera rotundifolia]